MFSGKNIVVGVCGGIGAYKAVEIVSRLHKAGAAVNVVMTSHAVNFVAPLTFQSISHNQVITDMFTPVTDWDIKHIELAKKADMLLIAPATANMIGKVASGIADDMLSTIIMAVKAPVLFVPAMNTAMYENPVFRENVDKLLKLGYLFMEPDTGELACGDTGAGRLPGPVEIVKRVGEILSSTDHEDMKGMKVLVTAGPTREAIDPVRYITNHSSGKMGYAFAEAAIKRGASVRLISGPVSIKTPKGVEHVPVVSAEDMHREVMSSYSRFDMIILMAAVADYRCGNAAKSKIKKKDADMVLKLERNTDIAAELGKVKGGRIVVGSCAETEDLVDNASEKLKRKNFDLIMANDVTMEGAGFGVDTNIVKILKKDGTVLDLPMMSKLDVAHKVLDEALGLKK